MLAQLGDLCGGACDEDWLGDGGGSCEARAWDLGYFLELTACRIRLFGWLSKSKAFEQGRLQDATANNVLKLLTPPHPAAGQEARKEWEEFRAKHTVEDADGIRAEAAIEWARDLEPGDNDYLANVNLVARVGAASRKTAGVAASILVAYAKAQEEEIKRQQQTAKPPSNWIGEVGKRINLMTVTVERVIANETAWGVTGIHKMTDEAGNDLVWFASSDWLKEGETARVAATVKAHGEFRGHKQTTLTRVTVWTEEGYQAHLSKEAKKAARAAKKAAKVSG